VTCSVKLWRFVYPIFHCVSYSMATEQAIGRPRRRWEDNIKTDLREVGCGVTDWMELGQDRDMWRALLNAIMNLRAP
jgi:uncharacterized protein YebE (UPF0316 family)